MSGLPITLGCYFFNESGLNANEAVNGCSQDSYLAVVDNEEEFEYLRGGITMGIPIISNTCMDHFIYTLWDFNCVYQSTSFYRVL